MTATDYCFFLGGADLEMNTIRQLLFDIVDQSAIVDKQLQWGARASAYGPELAACLDQQKHPVLIELIDDLPQDFARDRCVWLDHHGPAAGAGTPSALRQVFGLLARESPGQKPIWTRHYTLVEANDVGHIRGLKDVGASDSEIIEIRAADRQAQGITPAIEAASRAAIAGRRKLGRLTLIETDLPTASAITDFMDESHGGPNHDEGIAHNLLVRLSGKLAFYGSGRVIGQLVDVPGCWYGGALPERGYWGCQVSGPEAATLVERIAALVNAGPE